MKNKIFLLIVFGLIAISGCDSVYKYVFMPPERIEYTLVPDWDNLKTLNDTTYKISKDGNTIIIDKKDFKIEFKYITDYQLNNFEFPEDSKGGEFSRNPFTYGDWIDPLKGYTPNRFTNFKITIYNDSGSKINYDPELTTLESDRGDLLRAYGREKKSSKYMSIEEYYLKRKGASGLDDEVFESRMGIARRTMIFLGKPIYAGDFKEGFVVFDPIDESVDKVKVTLNNFILGYNENNEPSEFANYIFYFKKVKFDPESIKGRSLLADTLKVATSKGDTTKQSQIDKKEPSGTINVCLLQYTASEERISKVEVWNPLPQAIPNLLEYLKSQTKLVGSFQKLSMEQKEIFNSKVAFLLGGYGKPDVSSVMLSNLAEYISTGGFLIIDNSFVMLNWPYYLTMTNILNQIANKLSVKSEIKKIPLSHPVFNIKFKFKDTPKGYDDYSKQSEIKNYVEGLFIGDKLVAVLSDKGYVQMWTLFDNNKEALDFGVNLLYYASTLK